VSDLQYIKHQGLSDFIVNLANEGTPVIGICGGYQILGKSIRDPDRVESDQEKISGLGLLNIETIFMNEKATTQVKAHINSDTGLLQGMKGMEITGYEIHMGHTVSVNEPALLHVVETPQGKTDYLDGTIDSTGLIFGSYIHGLFHNHAFSSSLLNRLRAHKGLPPLPSISVDRDQQYDKLADLIKQNTDMSRVYDIIFKGVR
jgi:adenosylcobyric acid synthase